MLRKAAEETRRVPCAAVSTDVTAPNAPFDEVVLPFYEAARAELPAGTAWFDAHTHIGHDDPDGMEADPEEILAGLDRAGHCRALLFAMHEPAGYPAANDRVREACAASDGRLMWLGRVAPGSPGALEEARRCLDAGASGIKLHPRSDGFGLPHPVVGDVVRLVGERGGIVLFHAGRGIPRLGEAVVELARENPQARLVLAHAGISDSGWIGAAAAELDNLFFDTAWWQVGDLLTLYTTVPPSRILYASDLPYGSGLYLGLAMLRCTAAVGFDVDARAAIAGAPLERVLAGEPPLDLGPPADAAVLGPRDVGFERVVAYASAACQMGFRGCDPTEALALARLACRRSDGHPLAAAVDELIARTQAEFAALQGDHEPAVLHGALVAQLLAGTPIHPS